AGTPGPRGAQAEPVRHTPRGPSDRDARGRGGRSLRRSARSRGGVRRRPARPWGRRAPVRALRAAREGRPAQTRGARGHPACRSGPGRRRGLSMTTAATLQRRLVLGGELLSVVATMKGLAAVSIHEFEEAVEALRHYRETVELGFQALFSIHPHLFRSIPFPFNSFPASTVPTNTVPSKGGPSKPEPATVVVVIGTDQGMCGPINHVLAQEVADWL